MMTIRREGGPTERNDKEVEIVLTPESHQRLMDHSSEQSSVIDALKAATHIQGYGTTPDQVVVSCILASAEALLAVAHRSCRSAVKDIEIAISEYKSQSGQS